MIEIEIRMKETVAIAHVGVCCREYPGAVAMFIC